MKTLSKPTMLQTLTVHIKRFDKTLALPKYQTKESAGIDLSAREKVVIPAHQVGKVPLNVALQVPQDYWVLLSARSSLYKKGVMLANGIGVGDYDYRGNNDEYQAVLLNFTERDVMIEKGERIVQMIVLPREKVNLIEAEKFEDQDRGGFGSTGKK